MITTKELGWVGAWASKAPYPGIGYAEKAAKKLVESKETYDQFYKDKEYDLILSNGEQLSFEIMPMNLCHMLGVDYKNLSGEYFEEFRKKVLEIQGIPRSYELLSSMVERIDDVLEYDEKKQGIILNYYRVMVKCSIFEKLSDFSKFNFGVINFNKDKYEKLSNGTYHGNAEKFLYVQSNEQACPYFMMGIIQQNDETGPKQEEEIAINKYVVETLFAPTNVKDFFSNQNVCIPTQILTTTSEEMIKKEATPANKIALLNQYKAIVSEYDLVNKIDIYSDYMAMLSSLDIESNKALIKK